MIQPVKWIQTAGFLAALMMVPGCQIKNDDDARSSDETSSSESGSDDSTDIEVDVTKDENGVKAATFDPDATEDQTLTASSGSKIDGASVTFPPGALTVATEVAIEEAADLATLELAYEAGATAAEDVRSAGAGVLVTSDTDQDAAAPFTLALQLEQSALQLTADKLVVFFRVKKNANGKRHVGIMPEKFYRKEGNTIFVDTKFFGAYQPVYIDLDLTEQVEAETDSPILSQADADALGSVSWDSFSMTFDESNRQVAYAGTVTLSNVTIAKCIALFDEDKTPPADFKILDLKSPAGTLNTGDHAGLLHALYACRDERGRTFVSPWSQPVNTSLRPITVNNPQPTATLQTTFDVSFSTSDIVDFKTFRVKACTDTACKSNCSDVALGSTSPITVSDLSRGKSYYGCVRSKANNDQVSAYYPSSTSIDIKRHGDLDTAFGGQGFVTQGNAAGGDGNDKAIDFAIDEDGNYVAVGSSVNGSGNRDAVFWRIKPDGTPDTSFNGTGIRVFSDPGGGVGHDEVSGVAIDSSGKIIGVGSGVNGSGNLDLIVWRLNADGTPDTSFSGDGITVLNSPSNKDDQGFDIAIASDGDYLIAGVTEDSTDDNAVIWRVKTDGTFNTSFGTGGAALFDSAGSDDDGASALALADNGDIYAVGSTDNGTDKDMLILRMDSTGSALAAFDGDGSKTLDGGGEDIGLGIHLTSSRVYIVGSSHMGDYRATVVAVDKDDGTMINGFDNDGIARFNDLGGKVGADFLYDITEDPDGRLVAVGYTASTSEGDQMMVLAIEEDGALSSGFGDSGVVLHNNAGGGNQDDRGLAILMDSSGKIIVSGRSDKAGSNDEAVLWRYWGYAQ